MATNKLFEAAADILSQSKGKAAAEPMHKVDAEVVDLGGPTYTDAKPLDDSEKIDATKAAKSATAPTTKPSDASPDTQNKLKKEEVDFTADIDSIFADDQTISEDFKSKVSTIFEARVNDRIQALEEETEARYAGMLEEAVEAVKEDLTEKVNDYLSYVVEQWIADNEIAIESGLRSELTEDFIAGLRNLFTEHYIDVPAEKVDLVEELATKVEELETKLNEEIEYGIDIKKALIESRKVELTREVSEGLSATQVEKIKSLAESVEFSTEEEYKEKLETIRENYFPSGIKKATESQLQEQVEDGSEIKKSVSADPWIQSVTQALSKTK
jgi:hypothetical protein